MNFPNFSQEFRTQTVESNSVGQVEGRIWTNVGPVLTPKKFVAAVIQTGSRFMALKTVRDGSWRFPGGKPQPCETDQAALAREVFEEVGISITAFSHLTSVAVFCDSEWWQGEYYLCTSYLGVPLIREQSKHAELAWLVKEELRESEQFVVSHVR